MIFKMTKLDGSPLDNDWYSIENPTGLPRQQRKQKAMSNNMMQDFNAAKIRCNRPNQVSDEGFMFGYYAGYEDGKKAAYQEMAKPEVIEEDI